MKKQKFLSELNINIIEAICLYLGIKTKKYLSSDFKNKNGYKKIDLLKYLLNQIKCDQYVTTIGSKDYLGEISSFPDTKININYFTYNDKNKFQDKKIISHFYQ